MAQKKIIRFLNGDEGRGFHRLVLRNPDAKVTRESVFIVSEADIADLELSGLMYELLEPVKAEVSHG